MTFTATVSGTGGTPTGTINFYDNGVLLATIGLVPGMMGSSASFTTSALAVGEHPITASYSGDDTFAPSSSFVWTQSVTG